MVTEVPPPRGPAFGDTEITVGPEEVKVNLSFGPATEEPPTPTTIVSTVPAFS